MTNLGSNNVTKLLAATGANLATFAVGTSPYGVAFDGANIWAANYTQQQRDQTAGCDGRHPEDVRRRHQPINVAFDGANIGVANANGNNVSRL